MFLFPALAAKRTAHAIATSSLLLESREKISVSIGAQVKAEARHGCAIGELQLGVLQLRRELAFMGRLGDGPPYRTLCGASFV